MTFQSLESMRLKGRSMIYNKQYETLSKYIDIPSIESIINEIEYYCYLKVFNDIRNEMKISLESKVNVYKSIMILNSNKLTPIFISKLQSNYLAASSTPSIDNVDNTSNNKYLLFRKCVHDLLQLPIYEFHDDMKKVADHTMELLAIEHTCSITIYKCGKCGARDQKIEKKQTAALDEAETIIATCNQCGNVWRVF